MQREGPRGLADQIHDQAAIEAHPFASCHDIRAGGLEPLARFRQHEIHADLFEYLQRCLVDRLEPFLAQEQRRILAVEDRPVAQGRGALAALAPVSAASAAGASAPLGRPGRVLDGRRYNVVKTAHPNLAPVMFLSHSQAPE